MSKLKNCGTLKSLHLKFLFSFAKRKLDSGEKDINVILKEFYDGMTLQGFDKTSKALILGNLPHTVNMLVPQHVKKKIENKEISTEEEVNEYSKLTSDSNMFIFRFNKAENVFDFIEENIVNPRTEGINEDNETDDESNESINETEEEQPDPDQDFDDDIDDDIEENETEEPVEEKYSVKNERFLRTSLIHRKGVNVFGVGDFFYKSINGIDHVYQILDGAETKPITFEDFVVRYSDKAFIPHDAKRKSIDSDSGKQVTRQFEKALNWIRKKFALAYGNAIDASTAASELFTIDKGKLVPGKFSSIAKRKNRYFSNLHLKGKNATLKDGFKGSDAEQVKFTLEISDYEHVKEINGKKQPHINVVAEIPGKEKFIVANIAPPTDSSRLVTEKGETAEIQKYKADYMRLLEMAKNNQEISKNTPVSEVYLPILDSRNPHTKIYRKEKDRAYSNLNKAESLNLANLTVLLESMGFGISKIMIDMHVKEQSANSSKAFIAVSPFHTKNEIEKILKDEKQWASSEGLHDLASRNNINIIYLKRKELTFQDYLDAVKGNIRPGRASDGSPESVKIPAMFNVSQSLPLLYRIAYSLEAMESVISKMDSKKSSKNEADIETIKSDIKRRRGDLENKINKLKEDLKTTTNRFDKANINKEIENLQDELNSTPVFLSQLNDEVASKTVSIKINGVTQTMFTTHQGVDRPQIFLNIEGKIIGFYRSSQGTDGKIKDNWYPFYGQAGGWIMKDGGGKNWRYNAFASVEMQTAIKEGSELLNKYYGQGKKIPTIPSLNFESTRDYNTQIGSPLINLSDRKIIEIGDTLGEPNEYAEVLKQVASKGFKPLDAELAELKGTKLEQPVKAEMQEQFERLLAFFFNNIQNHGINPDSVDRLDIQNKQRKESLYLKSGKALPAPFMSEVSRRWESWKAMSPSSQRNFIEDMAAKRYGYFPSGDDAASISIRQNKINWLRFKKNDEDGKKHTDKYYESDGGIKGAEVMMFFNFVNSDPALTKAVQEVFDAKEIRGTKALTPTFNPVKSGEKDEFSNIIEAKPVLPSINSGKGLVDLNQSFLLAEEMPMMPHFNISTDAIFNGVENTTTSAEQTGTPRTTVSKAKRGVNMFLNRNKGKNRLLEPQFEMGLEREHARLSEDQVREMTESLIGDLANDLMFLNAPIKLKDGIAIGKAYKGLIQLHSPDGKVDERLLRHEIFHKVLNEILEPESYRRVMEEGVKMLEKELGNRDFSMEQVEEYLAERYENTYGSYTNKFVSKLPQWMQTLYRGLRNLYRRLTNTYSEYISVLETLEAGGYRHSPAIYNHYDGSVKFKQFSQSILNISKSIGYGKNHEEIIVNGREKFDDMVVIGRSLVLDKLYQNESLFLEEGKKMMGIKESSEKVKSEIAQAIIDPEDGAHVYFPELEPDNYTVEDVIALVNGLSFEQLLEDEYLMAFRDYVKMYEHFDSLREYSFDFYDFGANLDDSFSIEIDEELEGLLDPDAEQDSKVSQLADRGALSGIKTMNKKVKFHLSATFADSENLIPISLEKAQSIIVETVNETERQLGGSFDLQAFIDNFRKKVDMYSNSPDSFEYKTIKAVWDKYFNPDLENSFLTLGSKQANGDPALQSYYDRHMDVLVAFLSAYSTVKVNEFVKPVFLRNGVKIRPTNSDRSVVVKNEYNSNWLENAFSRSKVSNSILYLMKPSTIANLFGGSGNASLSFDSKNVIVQVNGKTIEIPKNQFIGTDYTDINKNFIKNLIKEGNISIYDIKSLFNMMGFSFNEATILSYLRPKNESSKEADRVKRDTEEFYQNGLISYLLMAREMVNQSEFNESASIDLLPGAQEHGGMEILEKVGKNRIDKAVNITRENIRGEAEFDIKQDIYTPTKFSQFFKKIGDIQALSRIGSGSNFENVGSSKLNKDKINTPLMERINEIKDLPLKIDQEIKNSEEDFDGEKTEYTSVVYPNLSSAFFQNDFLNGNLKISDYYQLQTIESFDNNTVKGFLDMNDFEFQRMLVTGLLAGVEQSGKNRFDNEEYWHPADIQADRGYLPLFKMNNRYRGGFDPNTGLDFSRFGEGLEKAYLHAFNSARNILQTIANIDENGLFRITDKKRKFKNEKLSDALSWDVTPEQVKNYFAQVDQQLDNILKENPLMAKMLPENAVRQFVAGKHVLNRLINEKINVSKEQFIEEEIRKFKRFASDLLQNFTETGNNYLRVDLKESEIYKEANKYFKSTRKDDSEGNPNLFKMDEVTTLKKDYKLKTKRFEELSDILEKRDLNEEEIKEYTELEAAIKAGEGIDILKVTHPAVMDMYFTYRINNLMLRQVLFGELHVFKPVKGMENIESAYIPEYSKRLTGGGTSKINFVFRRTIELESQEIKNQIVELKEKLKNENLSKSEKESLNQQILDLKGKIVKTVTLSDNGLDMEIKVVNMENIMYSMAENPAFMEDIMINRTNISELRTELQNVMAQLSDPALLPEQRLVLEAQAQEVSGKIEDILKEYRGNKFESDDGAIYASQLFMSLARNSMGNTEGFPIKKIMKLILNNVDIGSGQVDYDKALNMVLTPELMDNVGPEQEMYLKAMYSMGVIQTADGVQKTLWDVYVDAMAFHESRTLAEQAVFNAYTEARAGRNGMSLISQPAMYANTRSSTKGTLKAINPNPIEGLKSQDENTYLSGLVPDMRYLNSGFGAVLDLTSEISGKDIALSSQMLYLLGIVGNQNHMKVQDTYKALEKLSNFSSQKIEREVNKLMSDRSIEQKNEAIRQWALEMIRKGYEKQGDFGAGYNLSIDGSTQSVSNPLHKNKMFGAIASKINEGIGIRVDGFKGIQLPATNFLYLYDTPMGTMSLAEVKKTFGDFEEQLANGTIIKRNLRYASTDKAKNRISETEIITGNFFKNKFGTGNKTISQIFTLAYKSGKLVNIDSADFSELKQKFRANGTSFIPYVSNLRNRIGTNLNEIEWKDNPAVKLAISKTEKQIKSLEKKIEKEIKEESENTEKSQKELNDLRALNANLSLLFDGQQADKELAGELSKMITDSYYEMNRALYGIMTRIPATGKNSSTVFKVKAFVDGYDNGMFVPAEWLNITGSDHDGDSAMLWQFNGKEETSDIMLDSAIGILSDAENAKEIFSDIDTAMNFTKNYAKKKSAENEEKGLGYNADDLYTLNQVRANNAVGTTMTGSSALTGKSYSYSYITKMQYVSLGGDINEFATPQIIVEGQRPSGAIENTSGMIPEKSVTGEYVYKWLETMTNSAIDNAKHLTMGALNIKRFNSDLHSALVFMGFSKETIASFFNHPEVIKVFRKAESLNDSGGNFYSVMPLKAAINGLLNPNGEIWKDYSYTSSLSHVTDPVNQAKYDKKYIHHLLNVLNSYADDYRKIQNVTKVSDQIKGTPYEQRRQFEKILDSLGFRSIDQIKTFIKQYKEVKARKKSVLDMPMLKDKGANKIISPRLVLALNPNLMAYMKSHLNFLEKTGNHIIYTEPMVRLRKKLESFINKDMLSRPFYKGKIDNAFYQLLGTMYLQGYDSSPVEVKIGQRKLNMARLEERRVFLEEFKKKVMKLKNTKEFANNPFVSELTFDGGVLQIKMSHNFDSAQDVIMMNAFRRLDQETRDQFFIYLLLTEGIVFKRHGIMKFITPDTHRGYNEFLKKLENDSSIMTDEVLVNSFINNFFLANKELAPEFKAKDFDKKTLEQVKYKGSNALNKKSIYGLDVIPVGSKITKDADKMVSFPEDAREKIKNAQREMNRAANLLDNWSKHLEKALYKIMPDLFDENGELTKKGNEYINDITENSVVPKIEENPKWSKSKKEAYEFYTNAIAIREQREKDVNDASKRYNDVFDLLYAEKAGNENATGIVKSSETSPYRLIRVYEDGEGYSVLYKLERNSSKNLVWKKINTYNAVMGKPFNAFKVDSLTPYINADEEIVSLDYETYKEIRQGKSAMVPGIEKMLGKKTDFFVTIDQDGKFISDEYQLADNVEIAESPQKIIAIANAVQKAFPGIKINFVKNQKGMRGKAKGWVNSNQVYINLDLATSDTPIHETAHILINLIEQHNPELFSKISELVRMHPEFATVSQKYLAVGNTEIDNIKETFVTMLGKTQAEIMENTNEENAGAFTEMAKQLWDAVREALRTLMIQLGVTPSGVSEKILSSLNEKSTLQEMFDVIGQSMIEGKVIVDLSSRQLEKLKARHNNVKEIKPTKKEILEKIKELTLQGLIIKTCN